jgi:hypothetical protein
MEADWAGTQAARGRFSYRQWEVRAFKETTNIADKHPKRTKTMKAAIDIWKQEVTAH